MSKKDKAPKNTAVVEEAAVQENIQADVPEDMEINEASDSPVIGVTTGRGEEAEVISSKDLKAQLKAMKEKEKELKARLKVQKEQEKANKATGKSTTQTYTRFDSVTAIVVDRLNTHTAITVADLADLSNSDYTTIKGEKADNIKEAKLAANIVAKIVTGLGLMDLVDGKLHPMASIVQDFTDAGTILDEVIDAPVEPKA